MPTRRPAPALLTLRRKPRTSPWVSFGWRVALVIGMLVLVVALHWFERDGLRDNHDNHVSFIDVIYFTMVSITTTGYGDLVLPPEWRLVGAIEALTGILMCGWSTAFFLTVGSRLYEPRQGTAAQR